ncbi:MAG: ABC transporter permease [Clostridiales bacterium]|jgi:ABC-2 type transport system permease protein|nr:ABC transporter permease [Clostridiales bacterium]
MSKTARIVAFFLCVFVGAIAFALVMDLVFGISISSNGEISTLDVHNYIETKDLAATGNTFATTGDDSQMVYDTSHLPAFSYVEVNLKSASFNAVASDASLAQLFFALDGEDFNDAKSVWLTLVSGRNFFQIPSANYASIRIDFSQYPGCVYEITNIGTMTRLPLRARHLIMFLLAVVFWSILCWALFFYNIKEIYLQWHGFKKYKYLLQSLVIKDFTVKYRRSALGVLWSVLNPLLMAFVMSIVFSNIMRIQIENYAVFYLTGSLIFGFMNEATSGSLASLIGAAGLIKKVYIPKYIFPLEKCFFALVNTVFAMLAMLILMVVVGFPLKPQMLLFFVPLIYVLVFSVGLGLVLATAGVFFRDTMHLYGVVVQAWTFLTPIIYPMDLLPENVRWIVELNPMYYYVNYFRDVMMYGNMPDLATNAKCAGFAVVLLLIGLLVFKRNQDKFILYV